MKFWKYQAIGNDFPVVDLDARPAADSEAWSALAILLADRRFGVGGDGLLAVGLEGADLRVRMFNPDGTEDFCGNGMRCAALHAMRMGWVGERFSILHLDRVVPTVVSEGRICTTLGRALYDPAVVPASMMIQDMVLPGYEALGTVSALTTGSTHLVVHRLPASDEEFFEVSPRLEVASFFPERTSVIWSEPTGVDELTLRIWERGVGETLGCGTGSSAAAADAMRRRGAGGSVRVKNRGGTVEVSAEAWDADLTICGAAYFVYEGVCNE